MKRPSRLLIEQPPLQVLPDLAVRLGLNEAIVVQQLHYWLITSPHLIDGRPWVYNTLEAWRETNFPFWSVRTLRRIFASLEEQGLIETTTLYNPSVFDHTKWYTLNYEHEAFADEHDKNRPSDVANLAASTTGQTGRPDVANLAASTYTETNNTETTRELKRTAVPEQPVPEQPKPNTPAPTGRRKRAAVPSNNADFDAWWDLYPRHTNKHRAKEAWEALVTDDALRDTIMEATRRQVRSGYIDNGQYTPHPTTWLNGRRWEDELVVKKVTKGGVDKSWRDEPEPDVDPDMPDAGVVESTYRVIEDDPYEPDDDDDHWRLDA